MPNFEIWLGNFFFPFSCCLLLSTLWLKRGKRMLENLKGPITLLWSKTHFTPTWIKFIQNLNYKPNFKICQNVAEYFLHFCSQCCALMCIAFHVIFLMPERRKQFKFSFIFLHPKCWVWIKKSFSFLLKKAMLLHILKAAFEEWRRLQ